MDVPTLDLRRVADAHRRLVVAVEHLDDEKLREPSLLPGWSVAHVLAHVARNADSHVRRTEAAARGEVVDQYPGGFDGRAAEIEASARRAAAEIIDDVVQSAAALDATWGRVLPEAWSRVTRDVGGRERPLADLPTRRWQEIEVHLVDLGIGIGFEDWPEEFIDEWLPRLRSGMEARLPEGATSPDLAGLDGRTELAWLYGRVELAALPLLAPWS